MQHFHIPTSAAPDAPLKLDPTQPLADRIASVLTRRANLEALVAVHASTLAVNDHATMHSPLVDPEGFPRSDIDVAAVRLARVEIIRLRNDLKLVERDMDALVKEGLARQDGVDSDPVTRTGSQLERETPLPRVPFAKVNSVAPDSPAQSAGLEPGDLIVSISSIDSTNHDQLAQVGHVVARSEGKDVPVVVQRQRGTRVVLKLVPRSGWGGRGLLGCHIVPYP